MSSSEPSFIQIDNEDQLYYIFVKCLHFANLLSPPKALRCNAALPEVALGNRLKQNYVDYSPYEGEYTAKYKEHTLRVVFERGPAKITNQNRRI